MSRSQRSRLQWSSCKVMLMLSRQPHQMTVEMTDQPHNNFRQCPEQPGLLRYPLWIRGPQYLHQLLLPQCHLRSLLHQPHRHLQKPLRMLFSQRHLRTLELPAGDRLQELRRTVLRVPISPIPIRSFWYLLPKGENLYRS